MMENGNEVFINESIVVGSEIEDGIYIKLFFDGCTFELNGDLFVLDESEEKLFIHILDCYLHGNLGNLRKSKLLEDLELSDNSLRTKISRINKKFCKQLRMDNNYGLLKTVRRSYNFNPIYKLSFTKIICL